MVVQALEQIADHIPEEIVGKSGGSSLADADRIKHVADIVLGQYDGIKRVGVVVSAPGVRNYIKGDKKITDLLVDLANEWKQAKDDGYRQSILDRNPIIQRLTEITNALGLERKLLKNGQEIDYSNYIRNEIEWRLNQFGKLSDNKYMALAEATGEFLMAHIFADYLTTLGQNVRLLLPEENKLFLEGKIRNATVPRDSIPNHKKALDSIEKDTIVVEPGFYGVYRDENGEVQKLESWDGSDRYVLATLRRGGSDITGMLLAAGFSELRKERPSGKLLFYDNYTDRPGIAVINPDLEGEDAVAYSSTMRPRDAMQITKSGDTVMVSAAMSIGLEYGVRTRVRSTFKCDDDKKPIKGKDGKWVLDFDTSNKGTLIYEGCDYGANINPDVVGIAYKGDLVFLEYTGHNAKRIMSRLKELIEGYGRQYGETEVEVSQEDVVSSSTLVTDFKIGETDVMTPEKRINILELAKQTLRSEFQLTTLLEQYNNVSQVTIVGPGVNKSELKSRIYGALGINTLYDIAPGRSNTLALGFREDPANSLNLAQLVTRRINSVLFNNRTAENTVKIISSSSAEEL